MGWADPVPDPLSLRKSGSAGNRIRDLWIISQELWPLDHRGGRGSQTLTHNVWTECRSVMLNQAALITVFDFIRVQVSRSLMMSRLLAELYGPYIAVARRWVSVNGTPQRQSLLCQIGGGSEDKEHSKVSSWVLPSVQLSAYRIRLWAERPRSRGSSPCKGQSFFFCFPYHPDQLRGPPSLLHSGNRRQGGKECEV
jgi:hypothetical protein